MAGVKSGENSPEEVDVRFANETRRTEFACSIWSSTIGVLKGAAGVESGENAPVDEDVMLTGEGDSMSAACDVTNSSGTVADTVDASPWGLSILATCWQDRQESCRLGCDEMIERRMRVVN